MLSLKKKLKRFFHTKILKRKYYKSGQCLGCGECCKKIYVRHSAGVIQEEKEFEKLRLLHPFYKGLSIVGKDETGLVFECSHLDPETNFCKIHKTRPGICRRYPQEAIFEMGGALSENCGYKMTPIIPFSEIFNEKVAEGLESK